MISLGSTDVETEGEGSGAVAGGAAEAEWGVAASFSAAVRGTAWRMVTTSGIEGAGFCVVTSCGEDDEMTAVFSAESFAGWPAAASVSGLMSETKAGGSTILDGDGAAASVVFSSGS